MPGPSTRPRRRRIVRRTAALLAALLLAASAAAVTPAAAAPGDGTTLEYDGSRLTVESNDAQAIWGTTDLPAGTELRLQLRSSGSSPFLKTQTVTVDQTGRFRGLFDFGEIPAGTEFQVSVRHDGAKLASATGVVTECTANCPPNVTTTPLPGGELATHQTIVGEQGDRIPIPITLGEADAATLVIGGESVNFRVVATVEDGTGDNRVTLLFDPVAAGHPAETFRVEDSGDTVTVREETHLKPVQSVLDAGTYPVTLYQGKTTKGSPSHEGRIVLQEGDVSPCITHDAWSNESKEPPETGFTKAIVTTRQNQTVTLPVQLGSADAATVTLGGHNVSYEFAVTVSDGTGDGTVYLVFDTSQAGTRGAFRPADGGDTVSLQRQTNVSLPLDVGDYALSAYSGTDASGNETDVGTLIVQPAPNTTTTTTAGTTSQMSNATVAGFGALVAGGALGVVGLLLLLGRVN